MSIEITKAKKSTPPLTLTSFSRGISAGARPTITFLKTRTVTMATTPEINDKQRAFRQQLTRQACGPCTQRQSNRKFAPASRRARQKKIGNIHACDQQHKSHRSEKDERLCPQRANQIFLHRNNPKRPRRGSGIISRILPAELRYIGIELRLRLRNSQSGVQSPDRSRNESRRPVPAERETERL